MNKRTHAEQFKNLILTLLFVSMLILWIYYMNLQVSSEYTKAKAAERFPEEYGWVFASAAKESPVLSIPDRYLLPRSVTLVLQKDCYSTVGSQALTGAVYKAYESAISTVFSDQYTCTGNLEDGIALWEEILSQTEDFVLIDYGRDLPYPAIGFFLPDAAGDSICEGDVVYLEKLLLYSDENDALCALATDRARSISRFRLKNGEVSSIRYDFNSNNRAAYTVNEGFIKISFNAGDALRRFGVSLPYEYPFYETVPDAPNITVFSPLRQIGEDYFTHKTKAEENIIKEPEISKILNVFKVNPNITGLYSDMLSVFTFVSDYMTLTVDTDGCICYEAAVYGLTDDRAVTINDITASTGAAHDFTDRLAAACLLVDNLFGKLSLSTLPEVSGIFIKDEITYVDFSYRYGQYDVPLPENAAFRLGFQGSVLVSAKIPLAAILPAPEEDAAAPVDLLIARIDQKTALSLYSSLYEKDPFLFMMGLPEAAVELYDFLPVYQYDSGQILWAQWTGYKK